MALAQVVAKVPQEEKETFYELTALVGTTPSNAIRMFISAFNRQRAFPFDITAPYPDQTTKALDAAVARDGLSRAFGSAAEMIAELDAND
ncbi:MAG: type II toxin-antitoxin system RelB/DinJ family antitoxin [Micrococcales bacterium]|nr:type II toxin-antitoxin system RelB/DinJ family antitoxin [Micrococcales bacterium]